MADAVLRYAGAAKAAGRKYGIPAATLLGLIKIESGGDINVVSPAGAFGLTQFMPATARSYGVQPGNVTSQIEGAARYLRDLGFSKDPTTALAKYNGGTNPPRESYGYAKNVQAAAVVYGNAPAVKGPGITAGGIIQDATGPVGAGLDALGVHPFGQGAVGSVTGDATGAVAGAAAGVAGDVVKGIVDALGINGAKIAVTLGLVAGGAVLAVTGVGRATGLRPGEAIQKTAKTAVVAVPK